MWARLDLRHGATEDGQHAAFHNITHIAVIAVCTHGLFPPRMAQAGLEQTTSSAFNDPTHGPLSNAIVLRPLWCGDVMWDQHVLCSGAQLTRPVGVEALYLGVADKVLERRG